MHYPAKIVVIDDNPAHLVKLETQIKKQGSACLSIKYEGPFDLPENPIKGVRLVFMDIELMKGISPSFGEKEFLPNLRALERLVSENNGPYALITWTSTEKHNRLVNYLEKELPLGKRPFFELYLDKDKYLDDPEKLLEELENLHNNIPQMAALLDWEKRVHDSTVAVLHDILELSNINQDKEISKNLDKLLSQLAVAARGEKSAKNDKLAAVNDALSPLLHDKISHICSETIPNELWDKAVTKIKRFHNISGEVVGKINLALHVSKNIENIKTWDRGALVRVPENWRNKSIFEEKFHTNESDFLEKQLKIDKDSEIIDWILIPYQAACDHAQSRQGPIPLILGVLCTIPPKNKDEENGCIDKIIGKPPRAVWESPIFYDNKYELFKIVINCRYSISMTRDDMCNDDYEVKWRIRDNLMTDLGHHIHAYGMRPGIIALRSKDNN